MVSHRELPTLLFQFKVSHKEFPTESKCMQKKYICCKTDTQNIFYEMSLYKYGGWPSIFHCKHSLQET